MEKTLKIRLQDSEGRIYRWTIRRVPRAINIVLGQKSRVISGWQYADHEGYERFSEGNWSDLVFHFKVTAENYGLKLMSELS
jgi:hypothetical protein